MEMPTSVRVFYLLYLGTAIGCMALTALWMLSPEFRYWLLMRSREWQYRWALWEYERRKEPVPEWVKNMGAQDLPPEPS